MKLYLMVLTLFGFTFGTFGILLPFLISAPSTIAVWGGIAFVFFMYIPFTFYLTKATIKMLQTKTETKTEENK